MFQTLKLTRELKVGVVFVASALLLYWGVNFLKGSDIFSSERIVYGVYNNVDGLTPGRPIAINGMYVGQVSSITFSEEKDGRLVVSMKLTNDFPIPEDTKAIINGDLLGNKTVNLILGQSSNFITSGDTLQTDIQQSITETVNQQLAPLKGKAEKLLGSLDTAITVIQSLLTPETQRNFRNTFANLNQSFENMSSITTEVNQYVIDNRENFDRITQNLNDLTTTLNDNREKLDRVFGNFEAISDTLAQAKIGETMRQLSAASSQANEILTKINRGEGSAGKLINDPALYNNLARASESLDSLLIDLVEHPGRYVEFSIFGGR